MLKLLRSHNNHCFYIKELFIGKCQYEGSYKYKDLRIGEYYSVSKYNRKYCTLAVSYKDFVHIGLYNYIIYRKNSKKQ